SISTTALSDSRWGLAGTPAYMAPEVILGSQFDTRADLFSLGIVFYEMLTGRNPFVGDTVIATTGKIVSHTPPPISSFRKDVDPRLERTIERMLVKDPGARIASANDLIKELTATRRSRHRLQEMIRNAREAFAESRSLEAATVVLLLVLIAAPAGWVYRDRIEQ